MKKKIYSLSLILWFFSSELPAQTDSVFAHISPINISAERQDLLSSGLKQFSPDSSLQSYFRNASLGDLLAAQSGIFIKSYSPGGVSSPSFRGTGSGHTAVLWQGFNLQNPMHGGVDFSLIPVGMADKIRIQPGGASALFGSGAMGGIIYLSSVPHYGAGQKISVSAETGSFGQRGLSARFLSGADQSSTSVAFFRQDAENDFRYVKPGGISARFDHGAFSRTGITLSQSFRINPRQQLHLHLWYFDSPRQLPPTAQQNDQNLRSALIWERNAERTFFLIRSGYFSDKIGYADSVSGIFSQSRSAVLTTESEARVILSGSDIIQAGANFSYLRATADGYGKERFNESNAALFGSYKHIFPNSLNLVASIRQGFRNQIALPVVPAIGLEKTWNERLVWRMHAGRNYRLPTFNDLYWKPGGNPDLLPESGFSSETGLTYHMPVGQGRVTGDVTLFHSRIKDWILWLPGGSFWKPDNVQLVWSRGVEAGISSSAFRLGNWTIEGKINYQWVKSTRQNKLSAWDDGVNRQLIYIPEHNVQAFSIFSFKGVWFSYNHTYSGKRYITSDHSSGLPSYHLGRMGTGKSWTWRHYMMSCSLNVGNIWNTAYQVVAGYPMPLRNYTLRLDLFFDKPSEIKQ
ncbi:MAG: TonB-dependent receptor plug domain-containing protein [Bacteroidia bacterium]